MDKLISSSTFAHVFPASQLINIKLFNNLHLNTKDYSDSSGINKRNSLPVCYTSCRQEQKKI